MHDYNNLVSFYIIAKTCKSSYLGLSFINLIFINPILNTTVLLINIIRLPGTVKVLILISSNL